MKTKKIFGYETNRGGIVLRIERLTENRYYLQMTFPTTETQPSSYRNKFELTGSFTTVQEMAERKADAELQRLAWVIPSNPSVWTELAEEVGD